MINFLKGYLRTIVPFALIYFVFFILFIAYGLYKDQYEYVTYVYAYPDYENSSKTYHVSAEMISKECDPNECDGTNISKIYFNNGGYIDFKGCTGGREGGYQCVSKEGDWWEIVYDKTEKIRK